MYGWRGPGSQGEASDGVANFLVVHVISTGDPKLAHCMEEVVMDRDHQSYEISARGIHEPLKTSNCNILGVKEAGRPGSLYVPTSRTEVSDEFRHMTLPGR